MSKPSDLSRSTIPFKQDDTLIAVVEVSQSSWLVAGIVPGFVSNRNAGVSRQPLKKLAADEKSLLKLLFRWRDEAVKAGRQIRNYTIFNVNGTLNLTLALPVSAA